MATVSSVITSIKSFLTSKYLALTGGTMTGSIKKEGVAVSWKNILDTPNASFLYQNNYKGYTPAINLKTEDGRVGIGSYQNYLALTYFLDTNTTNTADTAFYLKNNNTATLGGKNVVCVETWRSGDSWYRKYSDGWIEQGGKIERAVTVTVTFHQAYTSTPTAIMGCVYNRASTFYAREVYPNTLTTTNFTITNTVPAGATTDHIRWYACGY